jgi:putative transcriptional regulator
MNYDLVNDIKTYRRGRIDMTQQNLADRVGCTRQTIVALEKQKYNPSLMLALKISEILEVSIEKLFRLEYREE